MARTTRAVSDATGARILAVATGLFAARGYAAVQLEAVAEESEVSRGAVYHHFGSKIGLFTAVAEKAQRGVAESVVAAADRESDGWEGLVAGCRAFLVASLAVDTRRILLVDAPAVLGWAQWRGQDAVASARHLEEAVGELADAGILDVRTASGASALISGALNEAALAIASSADPDLALDELWQDFERMLGSFRTTGV